MKKQRNPLPPAKRKGKKMNITNRWKKKLLSKTSLRAVISLIIFIVLWEIGSQSKQWFGFSLPWIGQIPAPTAVLNVWEGLLGNIGYWQSWVFSLGRVVGGFLAAMAVGIPLGLLMAVNKRFHDIVFPSFEVLRPIPPLAWVPASIIFWPTTELSIAFVIFLGAFFTIVINVVNGAQSIDVRYFQSAQSMGSSQWDIFRRIVLPATMPSIVVGSAVGMGITWEVVVAAEMISGGGAAGSEGGGLGFFIWNSYIGGAYEQIVVGMISIGIAGYACSTAIRSLGGFFTPWLKKR
jgi:NitT/TauT family transport system permease protein